MAAAPQSPDPFRAGRKGRPCDGTAVCPCENQKPPELALEGVGGVGLFLTRLRADVRARGRLSASSLKLWALLFHLLL